ncbi:DUF6447 family protein [Pokkaliibacter plantistimulans]|uniref:DUF6447 family protein n=1 Tax=Pokkaliibacter plantistimulans TaxID=1635171 RepID=UPI001A9C6C26|nr:DUF6447 family protein [Pokkaliibacter plantistimulans]
MPDSLSPWPPSVHPPLQHLLPNEPRVPDYHVQHALTEQYLLPYLNEVEQWLLSLRAEVDAEQQPRQPTKLGKTYPLGQCLEISQLMQQRLARLGAGAPSGQVNAGWQAMRSFLQAGGMIRQVWGDLRREYFQNAFQVGSLYIDVANDTVVPTKPKVEILPFYQANFRPIENYQHFILIAGRYWKDRVFANHLLPELAPFFPLLHLTVDGRLVLREPTRYMLALTEASGFRLSEQILQQLALPLPLFQRAAVTLLGSGYTLASDPQQGRQQALLHCQRERQRVPLVVAETDSKIRNLLDINQRLGYLRIANPDGFDNTAEASPSTAVVPLPTFVQDSRNVMPSINIDNKEYDLDTLSEEAKAQIASIQFVDQELARLQAKAAALQTARNAYVNALKGLLPDSASLAS